MQQRGRKSAVALATGSLVTRQARPSVPLELTPEQGDEWQRIVDAMPADWFSVENEPLLIQYVRHRIEARRIAQLIDQTCAADELDVPAYTELLKAQNRETASIKAMAASMRLSQQAKYGARAADTAARKRTVARPWESD